MRSFRDPVTHVLKAYGYCDANAPGDLVRNEHGGFALEPGEWKLTNGEWVENLSTAQELADAARVVAIDANIKNDEVLANLKAMTNAEYDAWWSANVTTSAQAISVLKRLARIILRRVL